LGVVAGVVGALVLAACATGSVSSVAAVYVPPAEGFPGLAGESDLVVAGDVVSEVSRADLDWTEDSPTYVDVVTYEVRVLTTLLSRSELKTPVAGTTIRVHANAVDDNSVDKMTSDSLTDFAEHTDGLPVGRMAVIALWEVGDGSFDVVGQNAGVLVVDSESVSSLERGQVDATNVEWYLNVTNPQVDGRTAGRTATLASLLSGVEFQQRQPEYIAAQDVAPVIPPGEFIVPTTTAGG